MAIPKRTIQATCDIDAGTLDFGALGPVFTGENAAANISISLRKNGSAYSPSGVLAELYLYWPGTPNMTEPVEMTISGSTVSGSIPEDLTILPGCPLLVLQLTDEGTGELIVAASAPIAITKVRGNIIVSSRTPSPSEVIYVGRSPYVGQNGHWYEWSTITRDYVDTGVNAKGDTGAAAGFGTPTASVDANVGTPSVTVTASGPDTAKVFDFIFKNLKGIQGDTGAAAGFGTPAASVDANVGTPSVTVTASGPDTAKVFTFAFRNLKGETGPTRTVNGQTPDGNGNVVVEADDIPSMAIDGDTDVDAALEDLATAYFTVDGNGVPYITFYEEV